MARPKNSSSTVMLSRQQLENLVGEGGLVCVPKKWLKQLGFDAEQKTYSTGLGVHPDGKEIWTYEEFENRTDMLISDYDKAIDELRELRVGQMRLKFIMSEEEKGGHKKSKAYVEAKEQLDSQEDAVNQLRVRKDELLAKLRGLGLGTWMERRERVKAIRKNP